MKNTIKYTNEPIEAKIVKDFLPNPEELVLREEKVKVTLELSKKSLNFFKNAAKNSKSSYQGMIRKLLDYYVASKS
jgi:predicted DNA binding CopG/RHH family protein